MVLIKLGQDGRIVTTKRPRPCLDVLEKFLEKPVFASIIKNAVKVKV
jgi:hypothetical protein